MSFCTVRPGPDGGKLIPYHEALLRVQNAARESAKLNGLRTCDRAATRTIDVTRSRACMGASATLSLLDALGHISAAAVSAPKCTPEHDTSAMDGFAVCSARTMKATEDSPVVFAIIDTVAAGDAQKRAQTSCTDDDICVEIMTGARFPSAYPFLDAVVKVEDVAVVEQWSAKHSTTRRYIQLASPVRSQQHRRPAGSDFLTGEVVLEADSVIEPQHIAALASVGISDVLTWQDEHSIEANCTDQNPERLRIGVLSTGSEIVSTHQVDKPRQGQAIADSNGPYLVSALRRYIPEAQVEHLGISPDDENALTNHVQAAIDSSCDVIITSGGVSKGRYDLVRHVVEKRLRGHIVFHGVAVRPGAPVLFANCSVSGREMRKARRIAIFGAPGNPVAAAMTLRFFVVPYLEALTEHMNIAASEETCACLQSQSMPVRVKSDTIHLGKTRKKPKDTTAFWLARNIANDQETVEIIDDQASYKLRGLVSASCWVIVPEGVSDISSVDLLSCVPL